MVHLASVKKFSDTKKGIKITLVNSQPILFILSAWQINVSLNIFGGQIDPSSFEDESIGVFTQKSLNPTGQHSYLEIPMLDFP